MTIKSISISMTLVLILAIGFSGCAQKVNTELIKQYQQNAPKINSDETLVYIIREGSMIGALRDLLIGCNDTRYQISNGSFYEFKLKNKINTINVTLNEGILGAITSINYPHSYFPIDNRNGETIFLYFEVLKGFKEIDKDLGMTLVMESQKQPDETYGYDYGNQIALMNPSFFQTHIMNNKFDENSSMKYSLMKKDNITTALDPAKARIIFYRSENFNPWKNTATGIWSKEGFLGDLKGDEYFEIDVIPGKYQFFTKYGSWSVLDATVEANKTYYVEAFIPFEWAEIYTKLIAKKADTPINEINKQMQNFTKVTLDKSKIDSTKQLRLDAALPYIKNVIKNPSSVRIDSNEELKPHDGKVIQ